MTGRDEIYNGRTIIERRDWEGSAVKMLSWWWWVGGRERSNERKIRYKERRCMKSVWRERQVITRRERERRQTVVGESEGR